MSTLKVFAGIALAVHAVGFSGASIAQSYPYKPVRMITPNTPGSAPDILGRLLTPALSDSLGQPVVIENRVGASGMIGAASVARSAPDGYTFMLAATGPMVSAVVLNKNAGYDPLRDFDPIGPAVEPVTLVVARANLSGKSFAEVIEMARANPGKITMGSSGIGSEFHLMIESINVTGGVRFLHVPYKGTPQSMQDVVAGNLDITFGTIPSTRGLRNSGKLKVLAIASATLDRYPPLKDIPTIKEALPKFVRSTSFYSFWGPAGMPGAIVTRLNAELLKALALPNLRSWLDENGVLMIARSPSELRAVHEGSLESYRNVVKVVGIEPQ